VTGTTGDVIPRIFWDRGSEHVKYVQFLNVNFRDDPSNVAYGELIRFDVNDD
jgi:hypothetical protein